MFQDLDATIAALLQQDLQLGNNVTIGFEAPDDDFRTSVQGPTINFFLYDIRENYELRSQEWHNVRQMDGTIQRHRAPARVNCSYLITAWSKNTTPAEAAQEEHMMLGSVMKVLMRYRELPNTILKGSLIDQAPPVRAKAVQPEQIHSLGEFWQAMGGKPKASLNYTLTISVDLYPAEDLGPAVTDNVMHITTT